MNLARKFERPCSLSGGKPPFPTCEFPYLDKYPLTRLQPRGGTDLINLTPETSPAASVREASQTA
ncbi:MAG: hypothetical protein ABR568_21605, partial [Pyrinomonadaceae bacterium]